MATYGRGQMLGSGINPESFKQDYSGFANAAATQAQGLSNLGSSIAGAIKDYGEAKKEQKKVDAYNKASAKAIEAAITLGDSYGIKGAKETLSPFLSAANDPNLSPIEKAALLDEGKAMIPNVFGRFDKSEAIRIEQAAMNARNAPPLPAPLTFKPDLLKVGDGYVAVKIGSDGNYYDPSDVSGQFPIFDVPAYAEGQPPEVYSSGAGQSQANSISSAANMPIPPAKGGLRAQANAINNATELPSSPIYTDDTSELPPVDTGVANEGSPLLPVEGTQPDLSSPVPALYGNAPTTPVVEEPPASIALPKPAPQLKSRIIQSGEDKQVETFRPATAEESASYGGIVGQISNLTKKFYPIQDSSPAIKRKYLEEGAKAYAAGDKQQALIFAIAAGVGGLFTNVQISDLPSYFGNAPVDSSKEDSNSQNPTQPKKPLSEIIK